jgi:hypothetical protein
MQGIVNTNRQVVSIGDSANLDSFSRLRVSEPSFVFDAQFTYDLHPLLFEQITANSGAAIAHNATNRNVDLTFTSTPTGGSAIMQSFEHFRYQSGRSQLVFVTFNFINAVANVKKFAGYSDGVNGIEFQADGTTIQIARLSGTSEGNSIITQANWNIDKLDGTGPSKITLDISKTQILVIDLQALYVGRVRVGLDINGSIIYFHEFNHANILANPYIQTANLPVRCGMTCTGTVTTGMKFICCSVLSEGGEVEVGGYNLSQEGTVTAGNNTRTHILSIRPRTTFNSITNRSKIILESIEILVTGNTSIFWELCVGQAISGATSFTNVNTNYSAVEYNTAGTISGSPTIVLASGYSASTNTSKSVTSAKTSNRYPITLNAAGSVRSLGTLSLIVTGIGGTSATRVTLNWKELR